MVVFSFLIFSSLGVSYVCLRQIGRLCPIKVRLDDRSTEVLPTVLLGLRAAFPETVKASTTELVYIASLSLPG